MRRLLTELKLGDGQPMEVKCNNQAVICIAKNPIHQDRTKHMEVDRHLISEDLELSH